LVAGVQYRSHALEIFVDEYTHQFHLKSQLLEFGRVLLAHLLHLSRIGQ
jgi:hypothetical protein